MEHYKPFSVTQVNRYIKALLEDDALLNELRVEGELSNFKNHTSGHMYFTLKDTDAAVNGVMFAGHADGLSFVPENGMQVIVSGYISLYEKTGQFQLYAIHMQPMGKGALEIAFAQLRAALQKAGLFDPARKKAIPTHPCCVALVTSPTGAAIQDMIKVISERNPSVSIVLAPALVQGANAAPDIARAIKMVNDWGKADVLIVGRGGGSMEDLWAFNEEVVARAIAGSCVPIISAVGHETDFTIADLAADVRAPTPSAAAVMAVPDASEVFAKAADLRRRADRALQYILSENQRHVQESSQHLQRTMQNRLQFYKNALENKNALLEKLSPYALWKRGYTVICDANGRSVRTVDSLAPEQTVVLHMQDGHVNAQVLSITKRG